MKKSTRNKVVKFKKKHDRDARFEQQGGNVKFFGYLNEKDVSFVVNQNIDKIRQDDWRRVLNRIMSNIEMCVSK